MSAYIDSLVPGGLEVGYEGGDTDYFFYGEPPALSDLPFADYSNEGLNYPTEESTQGLGGSPINASTAPDYERVLRFLSNAGRSLAGNAGNLGSRALDFMQTPQGLMALLGALGAAADRRKPSGGGTTRAYASGPPLQRTMTQGKYGPIAQYAANGGVMHAYAHGGSVRPFPMQDGGFVLTKRAVDGAGGPQGMRKRIPEAVPIRGPGHGTSDSIPAVIQGPNGAAPAKVSNGEMYVPPGRNTQGLYALMRAMERKA